jgi:gluconolactonase
MSFRRSPFVAFILTVSFCVAFKTNNVNAQNHADSGEAIERSIEKLDDSLDNLIDPAAVIEVISEGHQWSEGPVWIKSENHLLFSDVPRNKIHKWDPSTNKTTVFMAPSGYDGPKTEWREPGSNGLNTDANGLLVVCDHGNRRVYRVEKDGTKTTICDKFEGKRFNSPNDLIIHSNGDIYFTDPPYGLKNKDAREIDFQGVYRVKPDGTVTLLAKELERPNGIGLSPDEKTLYVAQSHSGAAIFKSWPIKDDGTLGEGKILFDATPWEKKGDPGMPDGMAIDQAGNIWGTGPGGVMIISPQGKLLGRILMGKPTANCAFGDDGSTLYMTSSGFICKVKTKTKGIGF